MRGVQVDPVARCAGPGRCCGPRWAAAAAGHGLRGLRGLPTPPIIILTSSADRAQFGAKINSYWFIVKADISSIGIASRASTRDWPDRILTLCKAISATTMNAQPLLDMGAGARYSPADRRTGQRGHHTHNR